MLKYLTHKLRTQSINDENPVNEKIDGHDSGTESDGDLEQEDDLIQEHDMELSLSSRHDTASPTDTACSSESPVFLGPASHHLLYDQNSSEEELEVINGGVLEVGAETDGNAGGDGDEGGIDCAGVGSSESVNDFGGILMIASRQRLSEANVNDDIDDCTDEIYSATSPTVGLLRPLAITPTQLAASKRCSSNNLLEKRKRSLAHSSDDEVRHLLEHQNQQHHHHHHQQTLMSAPVNFRTSPPLEALKPHRGHILQRSTTPLILTESGRGLEHIRISSSSSISSTTSSLSSLGGCGAGGGGGVGGSTSIYGGVGGLPTCDSPSSVNYSTNINHHNHPQPHHQHHHQQQQQQQHHHHHQSQQQQQQQPHHQQQNSNNRTLLSTTNTSTATATGAVGISFVGQEAASSMGTVVTNMEISRSVSPPAKVFHCAVSPRRRQPRHQQQRLQRPHRPCLDFDKMQQLKARSVTTWRHSNEHSGELSVFCW